MMGPDPIVDHPNPAMRIWGWMSLTELEWLQARAAEMDSVVEVGSLHGRSATALLEGCPGWVHAVDPFNDPAFHCIASFMRNCGHYPNLVMIVGYSPDVIDRYNMRDVDMTFIDGMHDEASVRADIGGWLPKTRRLICGHDYHPEGSWPDVKRVVDEIFGDRVQVAEGTAIWYVELGDTAPAKAKRARRSP